MKKILAMLLLCVLLCAASTMALAATVTIYDAMYNEQTISVSGDTYTLPEYAQISQAKLPGHEFYGWRVYPGGNCYKPGSKIPVKGDLELYAHVLDTSKTYYDVKFQSAEYNANNLTVYLPCEKGEVITLNYPYNRGFGTDWENIEYFDYWKVEGDFEKYVYSEGGGEWGWLFSRAIADEENLSEEDLIVINGQVTATAIWKNSGNQGGGNDDGNGGNDDGGNTDGGNGGNNDGGNGGGNGGGNTGGTTGSNGAAVENLPKTGDESSLALWMALLAMTGAALVLLRKRAHN